MGLMPKRIIEKKCTKGVPAQLLLFTFFFWIHWEMALKLKAYCMCVCDKFIKNTKSFQQLLPWQLTSSFADSDLQEG